ncbi:hypothetical protein DMUE_3004 [Dictyocoela muelleri]|nr:hypothetical protein DMUE_3004 [Dictyocoela muelleri]
MSLNAKGKSTDFYEFRCSKCGKKSSIRNDSFMMDSKLSIFEVLTIIMCFCINKDNKEFHELTGICLPVICKWYRRLRIAGKRFLRESMIRLGGEKKIVEIDETVISKRKYNRGRIRDNKWVFGCIERGSDNFIIKNIDSRSREDLLRVIKETVLENTM